jgi:hypothetical protein
MSKKTQVVTMREHIILTCFYLPEKTLCLPIYVQEGGRKPLGVVLGWVKNKQPSSTKKNWSISLSAPPAPMIEGSQSLRGSFQA